MDTTIAALVTNFFSKNAIWRIKQEVIQHDLHLEPNSINHIFAMEFFSSGSAGTTIALLHLTKS